MPNGRCPAHGGKSIPPGPGHHSYRHGKRSKLRVPDHLHERLKEELSREDLLEMRRNIALLNVRINEVLSTIGEVGDIPTLKDMRSLVTEATEKLQEGEADRVRELLKELGKAVSLALDHERAWRQFERLAQEVRKLSDSERNAMVKGSQVLTISQAVHAMNTMVMSLVEVVKELVTAGELNPASGDKILRGVRGQYAALVGTKSDEIRRN